MVDIRGGILVVKETATGNVNGVNTLFSTSKKYVSGTLRVELNGQKLVKDEDYSETTDQTFTMNEAPLDDLGYADKITVEYEQK